MSKKNIQVLTKEMATQGREIMNKLKDLQDDVRVEVTELRKQNEILEKKAKEEKALIEDVPVAKNRITAYVMPDDPEVIVENTAETASVTGPVSVKVSPPKATASKKAEIAKTQNKVPAEPKVAVVEKKLETKTSEKKPFVKNSERKGSAKQVGFAEASGGGKKAPKTAPETSDKSQAPKHQNRKSDKGQGASSGGDERTYSKAANQRRKKRHRRRDTPKTKIEPIIINHAVINTEMVTIKILSEKLGKPASDIIRKLLMIGIISNINAELDFDTAELIASEYDITLEHDVAKSAEEVMLEEADSVDDEENLVSRPPVITIMGHVDHGKTSLLDSYRKSSVTSSEAGGITQHIGAYTVHIGGKDITFLDTPGHEAFTAMRARGAQSTDIAILVVAADDGVMPQTIEAINHAKAAGVPIIVAMNKIDKPDSNPQRIMQQLAEHNIVVEEWGGEVISVPVSAKTGENLDKLLEMILLVAEIEDFKANPDRAASGIVIEAKLDRGRGPVATVLLKNGTLNIGDNIIAGTSFGRVRAMYNDKSEKIEVIKPGYAVEILGLNEVPDAGNLFHVVDADKIRSVASERKNKIKADRVQAVSMVSLDNLFDQIAEGQMKELNIIVKADTHGSVEAVQQSMEKLSNEEVRVKAIHGGVGAITETDVMFASASNAIIIGFNVRPEPLARELAEKEKVDMRLYRVIYNAIEDIEAAMRGILDPKFKEVELGRAEVRDVFKVTGAGSIAGSYVVSGKIVRNAEIRIVRDGIVVHEGRISSLKRFKDDAKEVNTNYECGIGIENYNDVKTGDVIECFEIVEVER